MINIENVTKYYGNNPGIINASIKVRKNEIVGLLGRNGAGKSTCLNIITGYISFDEGSVTINGHDILEEPASAKEKIGYLPEKPPLYMDMTVNEYLYFCADLKGIESELRAKHIDEIAKLTGITEVRKRLCRNLSKGYIQRVGIAQALIGNPEILILDEPTIGLDPNQIIEIRKLIKTLGKTHTIVLSSHILGEVEQICDRIVIIDKGIIAADDTLENLTKTLSGNEILHIRVKGESAAFEKDLGKTAKNAAIEKQDNKEKEADDYLIKYDKSKNIREDVFNLAVKHNMKIIMMQPVEKTLEDVFIQITNKAGGTGSNDSDI